MFTRKVAHIKGVEYRLYFLPLFESDNKEIVNINLLYSEYDSKYILRGMDGEMQNWILFDYLHEDSVRELMNFFVK